jgi:hypothetical protein
MGLESINLLNCTVRPFRLYMPLRTITSDHAKEGLSRRDGAQWSCHALTGVRHCTARDAIVSPVSKIAQL